MLEDLRHAWREAVANFWTELRADEHGSERLRGMQRELAAARAEQRRLETEIARCRTRLAAERQEEEICRRRERLALEAEDGDTARLARLYATRHEERGDVLERKIEALEAEHDLLTRDIGEMDRATAELRARTPEAASPRLVEEEDAEDAARFARLRERERERAAEARLEEMKRRMR